jgi:hypothetical protein
MDILVRSEILKKIRSGHGCPYFSPSCIRTREEVGVTKVCVESRYENCYFLSRTCAETLN